MRPPTVGLAAACSAVLLVAGGTAADVLHLENGNSLEGVLLVESPEQVRIRLAFGELELPRSSVSRIDRSPSPLGDFLARSSELLAREAPAEEWLELARWARARGLDHSGGEAARYAALLEPRLPGLAPLMLELGYVLDPELEVWVTRDELMRRRGYVRVDGQWMRPEEPRLDRLAAAEARRSRRASEQQERLARALELLVMTQILDAQESLRLREERRALDGRVPIHSGSILGVRAGVWAPAIRRPPAGDAGGADHRGTRSGAAPAAYLEALLARPPGSLIPPSPSPTRRHGGHVRFAPGSD